MISFLKILPLLGKQFLNHQMMTRTILTWSCRGHTKMHINTTAVSHSLSLKLYLATTYQSTPPLAAKAEDPTEFSKPSLPRESWTELIVWSPSDHPERMDQVTGMVNGTANIVWINIMYFLLWEPAQLLKILKKRLAWSWANPLTHIIPTILL